MATTSWPAITGKGPSARHEIFYLGESTVGAVRIDDYKFRFIDQPQGWLGEKTHPDVPYITNLRLDPFERMGWPTNGTKDGVAAILRLVQVPILALRVRPADQWARKSKPSSTTRRCSAAPASTSTPSRRRWGKGWPKRKQRPKAPATSRNNLHEGRLARAALEMSCSSPCSLRPPRRIAVSPAS